MYNSIKDIRDDLDKDHNALILRFKNNEISADELAAESNKLLDYYENEIKELDAREQLHPSED